MSQADSPIPSEPSRRSFLRGAPAGAVSAAMGLAALPAFDAISMAINAHKAAREAVERHKGPEDLPDDLVDAEGEALVALAETPCADDGQFFAKLSYMLAVQKQAFRAGWTDSYAAEILTALDLHLAGKTF